MKKKLTATDLMVGDWVMYNPNVFIEDEYEPPKKPYPERIETGEEIDCAIEECYFPIPLTVDILLKNGWIEESEGVFTYFKSAADGFIKIRLEDRDDGEWRLLVVNYDKFNDSDIFFSIDKSFLKVHQLQHAMKLCGIKKEIEL